MKYEITDVNGRTKSFATAKELFDELSDRNNGWWEGKGSIIEKNGAELFNTKQYLDCVNHLETGETISIKKILSRAEELSEMHNNIDYDAMREVEGF